MSDENQAARIVALEKAVDGLQRDLAQLRGELAREVSSPAPAPSQPARPLVVEARTGLDFETLVGRYGMLALATLLALAAAGTFVGWAVSHGLLGPVPRVVLGLVAAAAIGAWGTGLRPRERSFGDSLLGLSLAITHVCAWAAGPGLHLVPPFVALALSAVASVALAGFALVQDDEPLWCVGFGGAAVAPFVCSSGEGTAPMLAAYAAAVLIAGGSALGSRAWTIAARVFGAAALLFVVALSLLPASQHPAELALALPFAVAALGVMPFVHGAAIRPRLRTLGLLAGAAALRLTDGVSSFTITVAAALAGLAWLVLVELVDSEPAGTLVDGFGDAGATVHDWIDGALIPCAFLLALLAAVGVTKSGAAAFALAAAVLVFFTSRREGALRDASALVAFAAALLALLGATVSSMQLAPAGVSAVAVLFLVLERFIETPTWRRAPLLALALAGLDALWILTERSSFEYVPFATEESAVALAVAVAFAAAAWLSRERPARLLAALFVFGWVHQELLYAVSPSVSTLLIVSWYAVTGVACVGFGRARFAPRIRQAGLGLGVVAALLALRAAWDLPSPGARIGAYLVVSVFLLGIAWWYRQPGPGAAAPEAR